MNSVEEIQVKPPPPQGRNFLQLFKVMKNWKFFAIYIIPAALVGIFFLPFTEKKANRALFIMTVTGSYWMFDCMPISAAAFVPLILLPLLKIKEAKEVMDKYMEDVNMMTFGCCILVQGAMSAGLSKRLAIKVLSLVCTDLRKIMFLLMFLTGFFSMWFVNTATMIFMMNVVEEIVTELNEGVYLGTLGDQKMEEFNKACSESNMKEPNTVVQDPKSNLPVLTTNPKEKAIENPTKDVPPEKNLKQGSIPDINMPNVEAANLKREDELFKKSTESVASYAAAIVDTEQENVTTSELGIIDKIKIENDELLESYKISLFHAIAISGNIGGLFWPYCSTSSVAIYYYAKSKSKLLDFHLALWMNFTFPIILISFIVASLYLNAINFGLPFPSSSSTTNENQNLFSKFFRRNRLLDLTQTTPDTKEKLRTMFRTKYDVMKTLNSHEIGIIVVITLSVLLFVWRSPIFMPGWHSWFELVILKDSTVAIFAAVVSFVIPKCGADMFRGPKGPDDKASFTALVSWKALQLNFPWGLLIFIGGCTALANGFLESSQFCEHLTRKLSETFVTSNHPALVLLVSMTITSALAHFISNTTAALVAVTVLQPLSVNLGYSPVYLVIPCVAVCSLAFLLPAGTPTMALAHMRTHKLNGWYCFRKGWPITLFCFAVVYSFGLFYTEKLVKYEEQ